VQGVTHQKVRTAEVWSGRWGRETGKTGDRGRVQSMKKSKTVKTFKQVSDLIRTSFI
jgi:hypothetical protein